MKGKKPESTSTPRSSCLFMTASRMSAFEGTIIRGVMMDMARNGMRMESNIAVPAGSILSMTVAQTGQMVTLYHLTGEVGWVSTAEKTNQLGISIFNIEDFGRWEELFCDGADR